MKPLHYILIGVGATALLLCAGGVVGYRIKSCPTTDIGLVLQLRDSADARLARLAAQEAQTASARAEVQALQELLSQPVKPRVDATYSAAYGMSVQHLADSLLASPRLLQ